MISSILLVGIGFFMGLMLSILLLDMLYKELMKKALDEVGRQYKTALDIVERRAKENLCSQARSKDSNM